MSVVTVRQANSDYYTLSDNLEKVSDFDRSHLTKAALWWQLRRDNLDTYEVKWIKGQGR